MKKKQKPKRRCPFCNVYDSALSRHIRRKHKDNDRVEKALSLPKRERNKLFDLFKNEGILKTNLDEIGKDNPVFETDRKQNKTVASVVCSGCNKYLYKSSLAKHRKTCIGEGPKTYGIEIPFLKRSDLGITDDFKAQIVSTMRNDSIGMKCKKDDSILLFGFRLFDKVKRRDDNIMGSRKDIRTKMRGLAHLHHVFVTDTKPPKQFFNSVKDLFIIKNFEVLKSAINIYTTDSSSESFKSGLKVNLQYLLIKAARVFMANALTEEKDEEVKMFDQFLTLLNVWKVDMSIIPCYLLFKWY